MRNFTIAAMLLLASLVSANIQIARAADEMQQPAGMHHTVLQRVDLTGASGMEVLLGVLEVQPGTTVPRHFHYGEEVAYVLAGTMVETPGKAPQMLETGSTIHNAREVVHGGIKVVGDTPLKVLTVHIVDKGKPLYVEAK